MKKLLLLLLMALNMTTASANDDAIKKALSKLSVDVIEIKNSPIKELKMVMTNQGILYVSDDGKYLFQEPLLSIEGKDVINVTQQEFLQNLTPLLTSLEGEMIRYKATNEKYVVTVFTDPTCGYCAKLHNDIAEYNKRGITINYLAFPRSGIESKEALVMKNIWCASDPQQALTDAFARKTIATVHCDRDIRKHFQLALQLGIKGTPALLYKKTLIPGYYSPQQLLETLQEYDRIEG